MNQLKTKKRERRLRRLRKRREIDTLDKYRTATVAHPRKNINPADAHHIVKREQIATAQRLQAKFAEQYKNAQEVAKKFAPSKTFEEEYGKPKEKRTPRTKRGSSSPSGS